MMNNSKSSHGIPPSSRLPQNYMQQDSNSKKRISWGGIQMRCFNEQAHHQIHYKNTSFSPKLHQHQSREGQNWDVSPQSLHSASASDRSQTIDASNLQEDHHNIISRPTAVPQHNQQQQQQQQQYLPTQQTQFDRLSLFFSDKDLPTSESVELNKAISNRLLIDSQNIPAITQRLVSPANAFFEGINTTTTGPSNVFTSTNNNNNKVIINNNNIKVDDDYNQDDDGDEGDDDSGSNLLDNIDRLSRLSGLFKDFENSNEKIPPVQNAAVSSNSNKGILMKEEQESINPFYQSTHIFNTKNAINIFDEGNQQNNPQHYVQDTYQPILIGKSFQQQQQLPLQFINQQPQQKQSQTQTLQQQQQYLQQQQQQFQLQQQQYQQDNKQFVAPNSKEKQYQLNQRQQQQQIQQQQQPVIATATNSAIIKKGALKQSNQHSNQRDKDELSVNLFQDSQQEKGSKGVQFSRLSEFFVIGKSSQSGSSKSSSSTSPQLHSHQQQSQQPQQKQQTNDKQNETKKDTQQYQHLLYSQDSNINDGQFRFSMGGSNDIFNESKSSNESSSYLYENLDTVNRLSEIGMKSSIPNVSQMIMLSADKGISRTLSSSTFSPSPLADDLKNLSLEFEVNLEKNNNNISNSPSEQQLYQQQQHQNKKRRKEYSREQLDQVKNAHLFGDNSSSLTGDLNSSLSDNLIALNSKNKQSISSAILSQSNIQKEISRVTSVVSKHEDTDNSSKGKRTPMRKSLHQIIKMEEDQSSESKQEQEFERVLRRIPLNSYEKNIIFSILTPGKKSTLSLVSENQQYPPLTNSATPSTSTIIIPKSSEELLEEFHQNIKQRLENTELEIQKKSDRLKELQAIRDRNTAKISQQQATLKELNAQPSSSSSTNNKENMIPESEDPALNKKNTSEKRINMNKNPFNLKESQYWQAYKIIIHHFGFEYLGKMKNHHNPKAAGMVSFRFLSGFLCSLQITRAKTHDNNVTFIVTQGFVSSFNSLTTTITAAATMNVNKQTTSSSSVTIVQSDNQRLGYPLVGSIAQVHLNKMYKNYESPSGNLIEILSYVSCRIDELIEFNKHMRILSRVYSVRDFQVADDLLKMSFSMRLTQFPDKIVRFTLSTEAWYNDISIAITEAGGDSVNNDKQQQVDFNPDGSSVIAGSATNHQYTSDEIDKQINTCFNSKINSQSSYSKLKGIIDAINLKNSLGPPSANDTSASISANTSTATYP